MRRPDCHNWALHELAISLRTNSDLGSRGPENNARYKCLESGRPSSFLDEIADISIAGAAHVGVLLPRARV